jgi:hypothetical protein
MIASVVLCGRGQRENITSKRLQGEHVDPTGVVVAEEASHLSESKANVVYRLIRASPFTPT